MAKTQHSKEPRTLALLPLRDMVVFPHMVLPLFVGRAKSVAALEKAMEDDEPVFLLTQRRADDEDPQAEGCGGLGLLRPVGAGLGAALLHLLGGREDGRLHGSDRGGGAGGGEVVGQLGAVGPGAGGDPHALNVLDAGLQDDVVRPAPAGGGGGDCVLAQRRC